MANKREVDYEKLVKCLAEKNLSSEHFSDLRGMEHADYLKTFTSYLLALQEVQEKHYKNNDLIREMNEYILLDQKITTQLAIYKEKSAKMETEIADLNTAVLSLTENNIKKITELAGKFEGLEEVYQLDNIKSQLVNVQYKKEEIIKQIYVNQKNLNQLKNKFDLIRTEIPNFNGVIDEKFEKEEIKNFGDLATNKKRLADISKSYNELSKKIENLKRQ